LALKASGQRVGLQKDKLGRIVPLEALLRVTAVVQEIDAGKPQVDAVWNYIQARINDSLDIETIQLVVHLGPTIAGWPERCAAQGLPQMDMLCSDSLTRRRNWFTEHGVQVAGLLGSTVPTAVSVGSQRRPEVLNRILHEFAKRLLRPPEEATGRRPSALVFGGAVADVVLTSLHNGLPEPGTSLQLASVETRAGGKGLTQAVGLSKMGFKAHIVAPISDSQDALIVRRCLEEMHVETYLMQVSGERTPSAYILEFANQPGRVLAYMNERQVRLSHEYIAQTIDHFAERSLDAVLLSFELPLETVDEILERIPTLKTKNPGLYVIVTPSPRYEANALTPLARGNIDYLVASEWEARGILTPTWLGSPDAMDFSHATPEELARAIQTKLGIANVCLASDDMLRVFLGHREPLCARWATQMSTNRTNGRDIICAALSCCLTQEPKGELNQEDILFMAAASNVYVSGQAHAQHMPDLHAVRSHLDNNREAIFPANPPAYSPPKEEVIDDN
jgi:sugar/nucleoside kinase (ribokinase family)